MTPRAEESKHVTPEMCAVLRYTAEHGCMARIGEPWLGPARLLERQGLIVLRRCLSALDQFLFCQAVNDTFCLHFVGLAIPHLPAEHVGKIG